MQRLLKVIVGSVFLAALAVPASADRIDEIEKELTQAHGKLKSFTAKIRSSSTYDMGEEGSSKSDDKGTHEWMRQGETVLFRIETVGREVEKTEGQERVSKTKSTNVCDGKYLYVLSDFDGEKSAIKTEADQRPGGDLAMIFEGLRAEYKLKVLADDSVNGQSCYVIEGTATKKLDNPITRQLAYFSKEMGIAVKMIGYNADGKVVFSSDTTDIKVNVAISPDRFKFETPAGVTVADLSD